MRRTLKRRRPQLKTMPEQMGPSAAYLDLACLRMEEFDDMPEELAELVNEYGLDRAMRAARQYYGRWAECKSHLEQERARNQALRWANGGVLPHGL